jgi:lactobin A/cerein 7B family class IIb bacteriocin
MENQIRTLDEHEVESVSAGIAPIAFAAIVIGLHLIAAGLSAYEGGIRHRAGRCNHG